MTRTFLIATVAALAITAPAQAERSEERKAKAEERAQKAEARKAQAQQARPERQQRVRAESPQRAERPQRQERVRVARPERQERVRVERQQRQERVRVARPERQERVRIARPERQERVRIARPERQERVRIARPERQERVRIARPERQERVRVERQQREQRVRIDRQRPERLARTRDRVERRSGESRQQVRQQQRQTERSARQQLREQNRPAERFAQAQARFEERSERRFDRQDSRRQRVEQRKAERFERKLARVGQPLSTQSTERNWYDDYAAQRYRTFYDASPNYFYDYDRDDGYLYQVNRDSNLVTALFPLLGGAFSVGQQLPYGYSNYNVPYAYRSLYYDNSNYDYRYGDGAIYRVDPDTQLISAVVALLTGQNLGIGQQLPMGYDVYNVPYAYRSSYFDTDDSWYRYDDGYIYQVDPYSRMIEGMYPVSYGGYAVGYPVPSYASYGGYTGYSNYAVPYGYQNLYYSQPGYNYQYANNGIYQVDPTTQLISALVALVTGTNLGVGQMLPAGYDAYNVPYAYRSSYFDTDDSWYRYDDGMIYEVDPYSRMIETAIPVSYGVYPVGYAIPSYAGYAVPDSYDGLYLEQPGYDYRYANGGIYAVDPDSMQVQSLAALLTGQTLGVGGRLPMGYDAYNVPYDYRDRYYDTADSWYRYNDGYIYQVDPQTRLIQAVIDAIV